MINNIFINAYNFKQIINEIKHKYNITSTKLYSSYSTIKDKSNKEISYNCKICFNNIKKENIVIFICDDYTCYDCFSEYINCNLNVLTMKNIKCPICLLSNKINTKLILSALKNKQLKKMYKKCLQLEIIKIFKYEYYICDIDDCSIVIKLCKDTNDLGCSKCLTIYCKLCYNNYHYPLDCYKNNVIIKENNNIYKSLNKSLINKYSKPCPNCKILIQKSKGCSKILCINCNYEFCYECLNNWKLHLKQKCYPKTNIKKPEKQLKFSENNLFLYNNSLIYLKKNKKIKTKYISITNIIVNKEITDIKWINLLLKKIQLLYYSHYFLYNTFNYIIYNNTKSQILFTNINNINCMLYNPTEFIINYSYQKIIQFDNYIQEYYTDPEVVKYLTTNEHNFAIIKEQINNFNKKSATYFISIQYSSAYLSSVIQPQHSAEPFPCFVTNLMALRLI